MRFSEEKDGGGIQGWNLSFRKVSGFQLDSEELLKA